MDFCLRVDMMEWLWEDNGKHFVQYLCWIPIQDMTANSRFDWKKYQFSVSQTQTD